MSQTWFEELCEPCPHGFVKPYCPQCVGDELEAEQEERRRENGEKTLQRRVSALEATVERQARALDSAYTYIRRLESRKQTRRPRLPVGVNLSRDELIAGLEDLAVNGGDSAKVQAIKMLLALQDGEPAATANSAMFANLDEWRRLRDVEPRRGGPQAA